MNLVKLLLDGVKALVKY